MYEQLYLTGEEIEAQGGNSSAELGLGTAVGCQALLCGLSTGELSTGQEREGEHSWFPILFKIRAQYVLFANVF